MPTQQHVIPDAQKTPWQRNIEPNFDYVELLYTEPRFRDTILKYWLETLEQFTFKLVNTSESDTKLSLDVLRGKIMAYQEMTNILNVVKQHKLVAEQHKQKLHGNVDGKE